MTDLRAQKKDLRRVMKEARDRAFAENPQAALALRDLILKDFTFPAGAVIAAYMPFGTEIDTMPLMKVMSGQGLAITLPTVAGNAQPLVFRRYHIGDPLAVNLLGIMEPLPSAPQLMPDIVFAPLLAFDRHCHRLGYGGGYYDRTLQCLRASKSIIAVGLGFSAQEIPEVPQGAYDAPLDKIFTENQAFEN